MGVAPPPTPTNEADAQPLQAASGPPTAVAIASINHASANGGSSRTITSATPIPTAILAAPPPHTLTLALPIQQQPHTRSGREDCWSEGATATLIDAWGERYIELNRGNLKQKHWKDVAAAVSCREDCTKTPKTDVQCKNRLDTLKKKYKIEKAKILNGATSSKWPFFHRLDQLIGPSKKHSAIANAAAITNAPSLNTGPMTMGPEVEIQQHGSSDGSTDSYPPEITGRKRKAPEGMFHKTPEGGAAALRELTRAIVKFGEVYERVEGLKLQQMVEMERQRMGLVKDLELQRMHLFAKAQVELEQMKRGGRHSRGTTNGMGNHHHSNNNNNTG
ncbi:trihelix transcription factor ASIL2 [Amborella trichopoda]|uniref:Myb/SANT-like DNA-binding domain-containing protein n=1 Tax=Amborella trichopoda TaxID=13333 RepID=W1P6L6_AMBTC|nr:trihelix transcription factor ASIL2 [Amborella trichopoda]ERN05527.1 hypothetical protein AMTR_s00007p00263040 [Amborella trichopoda]|eukprot:XP_006843852.1 trihelix transcription factor ASIL2 [Amborella trichopoda]